MGSVSIGCMLSWNSVKYVLMKCVLFGNWMMIVLLCIRLRCVRLFVRW